ncbi:MAG: cohesin domain-containing protein [Candidatus Roizmanbacteria bacterium]
MYLRYTRVLIGAFLLLAFAMAVPASAYAVNSLSFDKTSVNSNIGQPIAIKVNVNADDAINSADVKLKYDFNTLQVVSVEPGDFFPIITNSISTPGTLFIGALPEGTTGKKGTGTIATVNFKAIKAGTSQITYLCTDVQTNTSKLNMTADDPKNVIDCSSTAAQVLAVSIGDGTSNPSLTTTPTSTPATVRPSTSTTTTQTTTTQNTATQLPQSGAFDNTIYALISGGLFISFGTILRRLVG